MKKNQNNTEVKARDEIISDLVSALNKTQKDGIKAAFFLDDKEDPSTISDWVSTGSTLLDLAISNRKDGGLPLGRMTELNGLEGTGKSLIAAHILANTQKKGGIGVLMDTENAAAPEFWTAVGVDLKNLVYVPVGTVEEIFSKLEFMIGHVRKNNPDKLVTFIVDSVAAASTEKELEAEHGVDGYNTSKSIIISKAMRKMTNLIGQQKILVVFTNQLRMNLAATMFGDKYVSSGGKALAYHCSIRVRLKSKGKLKKKEQIVGNKCVAIVEKNRLGPPFRRAEFDIHFDSGIQDLQSWYDFCKENDLFEKGMSPKTFLEKINNDVEFKNTIYDKICEKYVLIYKNANSKIDEDVEVQPETEEEDSNTEEQEKDE